MNLNDTFHCISTIVRTDKGVGTGFFYSRLDAKSGSGPQWEKIERTWIVTNRHVILSGHDNSNDTPSKITFYMRKMVGDILEWDPICLDSNDIGELVRFHKDESVDVAMIDVQELVMPYFTQGGGKHLPFYSLHKGYFSGENKIEVEASDDVLVIGYPEEYYDESNLYPIIKSGIIASRWGSNFENKRCFLIDAKLLPGSSGSVVLSKPTNLVVDDGIMYSDEKQFAFLGIYSGQKYMIEFDDMTVIREISFDLGVVWYANLVEEIIEDGIPISVAMGHASSG